MGAMSLAGHLQGARLNGPGRIVAEPELAAQRAAELAGAVFVEFPAALRWPLSAYERDGRLNWQRVFANALRTDAGTNLPFELAANLPWLEAAIESSGAVPLRWMRPRPGGDAWRQRLPRPLVAQLDDVARLARRGMAAAVTAVTGHRNHHPEILFHGRKHVVDDMKAGVLRQMACSVRARAFVSLRGEPPHAYSEHYHLIDAPTLVLAGGRDRIANAQVTREVFFDRIASRDKTWLQFDEMAHGEFEAAPLATRLVYPRVLEWVRQRA
jgi:alpha-beta hydrolase superfamily lysophospholipase